jgi:hypothetical protein
MRGMTEAVQVEAAELQDSGLDARAIDEVGIEVAVDGDGDGDGDGEKVADETFAHAERVIMSIGAPFVPIKHEGTIYIRPPVG